VGKDKEDDPPFEGHRSFVAVFLISFVLGKKIKEKGGTSAPNSKLNPASTYIVKLAFRHELLRGYKMRIIGFGHREGKFGAPKVGFDLDAALDPLLERMKKAGRESCFARPRWRPGEGRGYARRPSR